MISSILTGNVTDSWLFFTATVIHNPVDFAGFDGIYAMAECKNDPVDIVDIELHKGNQGLGFNILGGKDTPHLEEDSGIFVAKVRDAGAAIEDGRLQEGDKILSVNGNNLEHVSHQEAVVFFQNAGTEVKLKVESGAEARIKERRALENRKQKDGNPLTALNIDNSIMLAAGAASIGLVLFLGYRYLRSSNS